MNRPLAEPRDITLPIALDTTVRGETRLDRPTNWFVQVMGRLKPGFTAAQVQGNLEGVFRQQAKAGMDAYLSGLTEKDRQTAENVSRTDVPRLVVDSGSQGVYDANTNDARALQLIGVVVGLVLLLVCANVANLLLSRATVRQRELSVRLSMGATRGRLVRQLLTENLLLAGLGGAAGILIAYWAQSLLPAPIGPVSSLDLPVLGVMIGVTAIVGVAFGIAPAIRATRIDAGTSLKENSRSVAHGSTMLSRGLLVAQVAISLVLLVGAGLFLRTLDNLRHVDLGYDPNNLVFVRIFPARRNSMPNTEPGSSSRGWNACAPFPVCARRPCLFRRCCRAARTRAASSSRAASRRRRAIAISAASSASTASWSRRTSST